MGMLIVLPIAAFIAAVGSVLFTIRLVYDAYQKKANVVSFMSLASRVAQLGIISTVATMLLVFIQNSQVSDRFDGMKLFTLSFGCWFLLIVAILNLCICNSAIKQHITTIMNEKVCSNCGTRYEVGNKCPKCGSELVERK